MDEEFKTADFDTAVTGKRNQLKAAMDSVTVDDLQIEEPSLKDMQSIYDAVKLGKYENIERIRVSWVPAGTSWGPADLFHFIPKKDDPFAFVRHTKERIRPHNMITDVGSIPRLAGLFWRGLTPWGYAAAYLVHDWEFEGHHAGATKPFLEVRDTMMEGVKTLMELGICPKNYGDFYKLRWGVSSRIAKNWWDRPGGPLPPYRPEPC